jgi:hypothetical protein
MKQIHTIEELPINLLTSIEYIKKSKQKGRFGIDEHVLSSDKKLATTYFVVYMY